MTIRQHAGVHAIHPLELVSPRRLDLICKYLYFNELTSAPHRGDARTSVAAQLYEKHILKRTAGREPPDPFQPGPQVLDKQCLADYVSTAKELLASLRRDGFDPNAAVPYFADGTLGNGAHRVSAALALNIPVFAKLHEGHGTAWPFNWFVDNGFTTEELQRILYSYAHLKSDDIVVFVFYSPACAYWDVFTKAVAEAFYVVGQIDVPVDSQLAMYELVHDVYATLEPLSSTGAVNRKALLLAMAKPLRFRVLVAERKDRLGDPYDTATIVKNDCRQLARDTVAPGSYLAVHAAASKAEALNLARVLLAPNNLRQLLRRRTAGVRVEFLQWLADCRETCLRLHINLDDICVVGSSPLEVIGVRASTDIDFTLKNHYRKARFGPGVTHLTPVVDIVTAGYHRSRNGPAAGDDELIDNPDLHFMFRGLKFANPDLVLDQKDFYRRDKDVRDLEIAARLASTASSPSFDPSFEFASRSETLIRELIDGGSAGPAARSRRTPARVFSSLRKSFRHRLGGLSPRTLVHPRLRTLARGIRRRLQDAGEHKWIGSGRSRGE